jgi:murein DD-endopeptidase MepM/ murein hydrolase activator NlpD
MPELLQQSLQPVRLSLAIAVLFCLAASDSAAASRPSWTVRYEPARIVNGSPIVFLVTTPKTMKAVSATWLGHKIDFSYDAKQKLWFALGGVGQETKPAKYPLQINADLEAGKSLAFEKKIPIQLQRYPRTVIKVPGRYTAPSPEEQREIAEDKKIKEEAFKTVSPDREWEGTFNPPANAEYSDVFGVQRIFNGTVQSTHQGLDYRVPTGTPVRAVNRGRVLLARPLFFEGNFVVLDHGQGLLTLYLHMSKFSVKEGDEVEKGQQLGLSGGTGRASGPHLHLAVRWQGVYLNPQILLTLRLP